MKYYSFLIFMVFSTIVTAQQTDANLYNDILGRVSSTLNISCNVNYEVYNDKTKNEITSKETGVYKLSNNNYFYQLGEDVTIRFNSEKLSLSSSKKVIWIQNDYLKVQPDLISGMEELVSKFSDIELLTENDNLWRFKVILKKESELPIDFLIIEIDKQTLFYKKITLEYNDITGVSEHATQQSGPKIVISYKDLRILEEKDSKDFSFNEYVCLVNGKYQLTKKYETYKLYNQLLSSKKS